MRVFNFHTCFHLGLPVFHCQTLFQKQRHVWPSQRIIHRQNKSFVCASRGLYLSTTDKDRWWRVCRTISEIGKRFGSFKRSQKKYMFCKSKKAYSWVKKRKMSRKRSLLRVNPVHLELCYWLLSGKPFQFSVCRRSPWKVFTESLSVTQVSVDMILNTDIIWGGLFSNLQIMQARAGQGRPRPLRLMSVESYSSGIGSTKFPKSKLMESYWWLECCGSGIITG